MPVAARPRDRAHSTDSRPPHRGRTPRLATAAAWWGAMAGVGALVHGIGEVAQGNVASPGLFVHSWTTGPIAEHLGGEPGITLLPNLLASGIVTTVAAVALILAAVELPPRASGGWILVGLSAVLLLAGGGVGPPVIGLCAGAAALVGQRSGARSRAPSAARDAAYRALFATSMVLVAFLVFGSLFVAFVLGATVPDAFVVAFLTSVVVLPATIVLGSRRPDPATQARASGPPADPVAKEASR